MAKKKNGYTILNPVNGIFGLGHYPCLPTAQYYNISTNNKNQVFYPKNSRIFSAILQVTGLTFVQQKPDIDLSPAFVDLFIH
jgi:hypothetical protein